MADTTLADFLTDFLNQYDAEAKDAVERNKAKPVHFMLNPDNPVIRDDAT